MPTMFSLAVLNAPNVAMAHSARRFPRSNKFEQLEFKLETLLGFRNMQGKLEAVGLCFYRTESYLEKIKDPFGLTHTYF